MEPNHRDSPIRRPADLSWLPRDLAEVLSRHWYSLPNEAQRAIAAIRPPSSRVDDRLRTHRSIDNRLERLNRRIRIDNLHILRSNGFGSVQEYVDAAMCPPGEANANTPRWNVAMHARSQLSLQDRAYQPFERYLRRTAYDSLVGSGNAPPPRALRTGRLYVELLRLCCRHASDRQVRELRFARTFLERYLVFPSGRDYSPRAGGLAELDHDRYNYRDLETLMGNN